MGKLGHVHSSRLGLSVTLGVHGIFLVLHFNYHVIMLSGRQSSAMVIKITKW